ncbi:MAG: VRR-NUC domain-containing protein [Methanocorpusculum sp.]|nr:VRR-NUC domain-containing protein [Methanocorpusculum sp.]
MAAEKNFETKIKKFLETKSAWFLKYWGGAAYTKSGIPDLLVCFNGHFLGIEVKAANGKPSPLQIHNLKLIDKAGGFAILLYPKDFELFQNFCDCLMVGDMENATYNYGILKGRWSN